MRRLQLAAVLSASLAACATPSSAPSPGPVGDATKPALDGARFTRSDWRGPAVAMDPIAALAARGVPAEQLTAVRAETDELGLAHVRVQQHVGGVPVMGGDAIVHLDRGGAVYATTGNLAVGVDVDTTPELDAAEAREALATHLTKRGGEAVAATDLAAPSLLIVPTAGGDRLVWHSSTLLEGRRAAPQQLEAMVDARTGEIVQALDVLETATATGTGKSLYLGTVAITTNSKTTGGFEMKDPSRGGGYSTDMNNRTSGSGTVFSDADNVWGSATTADRASAAVDAQLGTALTWDYYLNVHGRNGIKNNGAAAYNRVHYSRNYANAFWSDTCFCMTYGDGDGTTFSPLVSLDVAGHEMSHGVTAATANLTYSGESGGLNEATSDIFGTAVEFYAANAADPGDYLIGEKITLRKLAPNDPGAGKYLRSMIHPTWDGVSVDFWTSTIKSLDVHYSSGIANNFFYLLSEGGTNDTSKLTVTGITRAKAEKIWYRALTTYMVSSTAYAGARVATVNAATDLYGASSAEVAAVRAAWTAVGVN